MSTERSIERSGVRKRWDQSFAWYAHFMISMARPRGVVTCDRTGNTRAEVAQHTGVPLEIIEGMLREQVPPLETLEQFLDELQADELDRYGLLSRAGYVAAAHGL